MTPSLGPGITRLGSWPPTLAAPFCFGMPISLDPLPFSSARSTTVSPTRRVAASDTTVSVPMHGSTDSLNVSVSMAVLAYEALRQRSA